jgi:hypothetical protein
MPKNQGFVTLKSSGSLVPALAKGRRRRQNGSIRGFSPKLFVESRAKQVSYLP